jgi:hypothetical protein
VYEQHPGADGFNTATVHESGGMHCVDSTKLGLVPMLQFPVEETHVEDIHGCDGAGHETSEYRHPVAQLDVMSGLHLLLFWKVLHFGEGTQEPEPGLHVLETHGSVLVHEVLV